MLREPCLLPVLLKSGELAKDPLTEFGPLRLGRLLASGVLGSGVLGSSVLASGVAATLPSLLPPLLPGSPLPSSVSFASKLALLSVPLVAAPFAKGEERADFWLWLPGPGVEF